MSTQLQPMPDKPKQGDALGALYWLVNVHATCITPFIRSHFGTEALGFPGLFAFGLLSFCMAADRKMTVYLVAWMIAVIVQRLVTMRLVRQGQQWHSRYAGYPWLAMKIPFVRRETTAMMLIEPLMCIVVGSLLCAFSKAIGVFVLLGFFSLLLRQTIDLEFVRKRVQRMRDAEIEQRALADRFRGRVDDF